MTTFGELCAQYPELAFQIESFLDGSKTVPENACIVCDGDDIMINVMDGHHIYSLFEFNYKALANVEVAVNTFPSENVMQHIVNIVKFMTREKSEDEKEMPTLPLESEDEEIFEIKKPRSDSEDESFAKPTKIAKVKMPSSDSDTSDSEEISIRKQSPKRTLVKKCIKKNEPDSDSDDSDREQLQIKVFDKLKNHVISIRDALSQWEAFKQINNMLDYVLKHKKIVLRQPIVYCRLVSAIKKWVSEGYDAKRRLYDLLDGRMNLDNFNKIEFVDMEFYSCLKVKPEYRYTRMVDELYEWVSNDNDKSTIVGTVQECLERCEKACGKQRKWNVVKFLFEYLCQHRDFLYQYQYPRFGKVVKNKIDELRSETGIENINLYLDNFADRMGFKTKTERSKTEGSKTE